jgi:hypothetical protein
VKKDAVISDDGLYRYWLGRRWDERPLMAFVMLNPSTADADIDDPTIRRCMGFARREECGGIMVVNLYALRATKPIHLLDHPEPEGPLNEYAWECALRDAPERPIAYTVAAWGANCHLPGLPASRAFWSTSRSWRCLGLTKGGDPRHPLYVRADQPLETLRGEGEQ